MVVRYDYFHEFCLGPNRLPTIPTQRRLLVSISEKITED